MANRERASHAGARYLKAGDVVELGIEGLSSQRQEVVAGP
jgi:2-keto-4-pentenoate hydratase/2-oxohepta-3-ene-1,7-dioic acid hydratase in catechol pathway